MNVVAIRGVRPKARRRHGNNPAGDVGEVEIKAGLVEAPTVLRDGDSHRRRCETADLACFAQVDDDACDAEGNGDARDEPKKDSR